MPYLDICFYVMASFMLTMKFYVTICHEVKAFKQKDVENTKKAEKLALNIFTTYLNETNLNKPSDKNKLAKVSKIFYMM